MKVISIQILPTYTDEAGVVGQSEGATHQTTHWAVYERHEDGTAQFYAESSNERGAIYSARMLCKKHNVPLEPYPWQNALLKSDVVRAVEQMPLREKLLIAQRISKYGDAFMRTLGPLYCMADSVSQKKIEQNWPELFVRFAEVRD